MNETVHYVMSLLIIAFFGPNCHKFLWSGRWKLQNDVFYSCTPPSSLSLSCLIPTVQQFSLSPLKTQKHCSQETGAELGRHLLSSCVTRRPRYLGADLPRRHKTLPPTAQITKGWKTNGHAMLPPPKWQIACFGKEKEKKPLRLHACMPSENGWILWKGCM